MDRLRQQGRPDPRQPGRPQLPQGERRAARLACGWQCPRRYRMGQQSVSLCPTHLQVVAKKREIGM